jgi:hypothetical protein
MNTAVIFLVYDTQKQKHGNKNKNEEISATVGQSKHTTRT